MTVRLSLTDLGSLRRLASGGQGVVFDAPGVRMQYAPSLVFKQYKPEVARALDVQVLESMPAYLETLPFAEGMELLSLAAWPCRLVEEQGAVAGFVMPAIPDAFFVQMKKSSGMSREAAEFQHLLNDESFLARRGITVSDRDRYEMLREVARALSVFHRHGIAVGDLSPKNLLFTCGRPPGVYFIDCDAMRFQGQSVMPQLETPGWEIRAASAHEELGTAASDSYKLGLLALRLLTGTQDGRDIAGIPPTVPDAIQRLIATALSADPARRPRPADWTAPLDAAARTASTKPPQATAPSANALQAGKTTVTTPLVTVAPLATQQAGRRQGPVSTSSAPASTSSQSAGRPRRRGRRRLLTIGIAAAVAAAAIGITVAVLLTRGPSPIATLTGRGSEGILSTAFSPDGKILAVGDNNGSAYLWDVPAKRLAATFTGPGRTPPASDDNTYSHAIDSVAFGPDGKTLAAGSFDGSAYLWDVPKKRLSATLIDPNGEGVISLAFSPDGKTLAVGDYNGSVYLWDVAAKRLAATLTGSSGVEAKVAFSPDGKTLAVGGFDGFISLWDVHAKRLIATFTNIDHSVIESLAFSPDGKTLAIGSDAFGSKNAASTALWDVAAKRLIATLTKPGITDTLSLAFSPDGKTLATGDDHSAYLWDVPAERLIATFTNNGAVAFGPDGKTLATSGDHGTYLWDISAAIR